MRVNRRLGVMLMSLMIILQLSKASIIKGKNVPRVGRSNEGEGPFEGVAGYVIKSNPGKSIPRMGRRNYDSQNDFNMPTYYQIPMEMTDNFYHGSESRMEEIPEYYQHQIENDMMK